MKVNHEKMYLVQKYADLYNMIPHYLLSMNGLPDTFRPHYCFLALPLRFTT